MSGAAAARFWRELDAFRDLIDRWELINGHTAFPLGRRGAIGHESTTEDHVRRAWEVLREASS